MPLTLLEQQLLRISKAPQKQLTAFRDGVYIETATNRTLGDLRDQVCADRLRLAESFLNVADRLVRTRPPEFRSAISRYYYAMYHGMRAAVYFVHEGDDHQGHESLPRHTPDDFPQGGVWENRLKDARSRRNEADYDPYPVERQDLKASALEVRAHAQTLLPLVRTYLESKGCDHV